MADVDLSERQQVDPRLVSARAAAVMGHVEQVAHGHVSRRDFWDDRFRRSVERGLGGGDIAAVPNDLWAEAYEMFEHGTDLGRDQAQDVAQQIFLNAVTEEDLDRLEQAAIKAAASAFTEWQAIVHRRTAAAVRLGIARRKVNQRPVVRSVARQPARRSRRLSRRSSTRSRRTAAGSRGSPGRPRQAEDHEPPLARRGYA
jgi:hypothetical protein